MPTAQPQHKSYPFEGIDSTQLTKELDDKAKTAIANDFELNSQVCL